MGALVETIVRNLVDNPSEVQVKQIEGEKTVIVEVRVHRDDLGKVIGKEGRIATAIRTLARAAATKVGKKVTVEIL
ncbi:MAG: KH domain-containing protein [Armatimonadetes bacterium]|nr:KH domain-containing protein [Armatimonadota bacterium]MDW8121449.1 KH domain-containing protein [Armatimonadota bacterium]